MSVVKIAIFVVVSAGIAALSGRSLRDRHAHGFYRFFAFESILAVILVNADRWFDDPFSARQLISWSLLLVSIVLAVHGFHLLRVTGRPRGSIEDTTELVSRGVYRWIRHPLYCSLLLLAWGAFLKDASLVSGGLLVATSGFLVATAKVEEAENVKKFGGPYAAYMKRTKMFLPLLF